MTSTRDLRIRFGAELYDRFGGIVRYGPFKGMRLPATSSWSRSDMCPKLLGTYEAEVVETLAPLLADGKTLADIGAADGYFAVGFLHAGLCERAIAFELNPEGRSRIGEMTSANGVADRLTIFGAADSTFPDVLRGTGLDIRDCVVLIDVEGAEFSILEPRHSPPSRRRRRWSSCTAALRAWRMASPSRTPCCEDCTRSSMCES